jgi:hypothetical protein
LRYYINIVVLWFEGRIDLPNPLVHFEIMGSDATKTQGYYGALFADSDVAVTGLAKG